MIVLAVQHSNLFVLVESQSRPATGHVLFGAHPLGALERAHRARVIVAVVHELYRVALANRVNRIRV